MPKSIDYVSEQSGVARATCLGSRVTLKSVAKRYGPGPYAVENMTLDVSPGEFITVLGPSGSGKTSALMMIAGFENVTSGDIFINEKSVRDLPPHKRDIGIVFQNYALFPHLTIYENIAFPLKMRKWEPRAIDAAVKQSLELVQLGPYASRYPNQLSGGQQQRVALARATVFSPTILLMDEPLGALDRQLRQTMQFEIKRIQKALGVTVLAVTHDQEEALTMSDRIVVMNNGHVVQIGTPIEIYKSPADKFIANFVGETNLLEGTIQAQTDIGSVVKLDNDLIFQTGFILPTGARVTCSVRPERIIVVEPTDAHPSTNTYAAQVITRAYSGPNTRAVLSCNGMDLVARTDKVESTNREKLNFRIDPADFIVVNIKEESQ